MHKSTAILTFGKTFFSVMLYLCFVWLVKAAGWNKYFGLWPFQSCYPWAHSNGAVQRIAVHTCNNACKYWDPPALGSDSMHIILFLMCISQLFCWNRSNTVAYKGREYRQLTRGPCIPSNATITPLTEECRCTCKILVVAWMVPTKQSDSEDAI